MSCTSCDINTYMKVAVFIATWRCSCLLKKKFTFNNIYMNHFFQAYNVALDAYDLVQLADVMDYLKKEFVKFQANERKCTGEDIYYKYFEGLDLYRNYNF